MKKRYILGLLILILCNSQKVASQTATAQICDSLVPVFNVNLSGQPSGSWTSPGVSRLGQCCGSNFPEKCIEFIVTLDSNSNGIRFEIASGAVPPGALYYQVGCGPPVQVGQQICLDGPGPHLLTFCKPGNNTNAYQIVSVPKPRLYGTEWVTMACTGELNVVGLIDTSIRWTSVPADSTYNSYLDCLTGCEKVKVAPTQLPLPAYVDYQVSGYILGGCLPVFFTDTIRVNFVNDLAVQILPNNPTICFGGPLASVTAFTSGGLAPYRYLWSNGATTQTVLLGAGTYTVRLTDSMSCSIAVDTVVVNAIPSAIAANAGPDQLFCSNMQQVNLNGIVNTATGGVWIGGSGTFTPNDTTLNATYIPSAAEMSNGVIRMMLVTTGNFTCPADTDEVVLTVAPSPAPAITGHTDVCSNTVESYNAPFVSGISYAWQVTGGTIISNSLNSINVLWGNAGPGIITLTETNSATCDSTITFNVVISPMPDPQIDGTPAVCKATVSQYTVINADSTNSFLWTVTGGTIIGAPNSTKVVIQWSMAGNASLTVTETNPNGCETRVDLPVSVHGLPATVLNGPPTICEDSIATYSVPFVAGNNYFWSVTNGAIVSFTVANSIDVNWYNTGTGEVRLREVTPLGCDTTVLKFVNIHGRPQPLITGPASVCEDESAVYTVNSDPSSSFQWTLNGGINFGNLPPDSFAVQWNTPGTGTINIMQTNSNGCSNTFSIPVVVNRKPDPTIQGNNTGCLNQLANTYTTLAEPGINIQWTVTGGNIVTGNGTNQIGVQWLSPGNNTITLSKVNATTGCDSTVTLAVRVDSLVPPEITASGVNGCAPLNVTFSSNVLSPSYNYAWNFGDGHGASTFNPNNTFQQPGIYPVSLIVSNNTGCADTVSTQVRAYESPTSEFQLTTNSETYWADMSHLTLTNHSYGAIQYMWDFGNGDTSTAFEPVYDYDHPGIYEITLIVTNQYGCLAKTDAILEVRVPEDIYVPSAFTPNGDLTNDYFEVKIRNITAIDINIFNRWGEHIFHSNDPSFKWDGTYQGNSVQQDVYVYLIKAEGYHGKNFSLTGSVTVLK